MQNLLSFTSEGFRFERGELFILTLSDFVIADTELSGEDGMQLLKKNFE